MREAITRGQFLLGIIATLISVGAIIWNTSKERTNDRKDIDLLLQQRVDDQQWKKEMRQIIDQGQIESRMQDRRTEENFLKILIALENKQNRR